MKAFYVDPGGENKTLFIKYGSHVQDGLRLKPKNAQILFRNGGSIFHETLYK